MYVVTEQQNRPPASAGPTIIMQRSGGNPRQVLSDCLWLYPVFAAYSTIFHCHVCIRALKIDYDSTRKITTQVTLDDDKFNTLTFKATIQESLTEDLPASISGRTLLELLSLSHLNDLESCTINKVTPSAWRRRTVVGIAREGEIEVSGS
jgi:hypothetical protein